MPNNQAPSSPILKKRISRSTCIKAGIVAFLVVALIGYLLWDVAFNGPVTALLTNRERLVEIVERSGPLGPILYILLQIVQTVVAPIPGQVVGSIGGFIFGPWGILWTTIGSLIGFWLVFLIARRFGRPFLEKIFKKSAVDKFDFIINAKGASFILFAIFLLPGFPDDIICYIAGLTNLSIKRLMLIAILGRFPTIVLTNYLGAGLSDNLGLVAAAAVVGVIVLGLFTWKREKIIAYLKRSGQPKNEPTEESDDKNAPKGSSESQTHKS